MNVIKNNFTKLRVNTTETSNNMTLIVRSLIWFHRIYGITFGGLVLEYTANELTIKCSKIWKYYGYIITIIITLILLIYVPVFNVNVMLAENIPTFGIIHALLNLGHGISICILLYYINFTSYSIFIKMSNMPNIKNLKITSNLIILFVTDIVYLLITWFVSMHFSLQTSLDWKLIGIIYVNITFTWIWILPVIVSLMSVYLTDLLDLIAHDLDDYLFTENTGRLQQRIWSKFA